MNEHQAPTPDAAGTIADFKKSRLTSVIRAVVALVICGGVLWWSAFVIWESRYPVLAAARRLHASNPTDRLTAVQELSSAGATDGRTVIPALTAALADNDPRVSHGRG